MVHVPGETALAPSPTGVTSGGLTLSHLRDSGLSYLLIGREGTGEPVTLLLPATPRPPSGLTTFSRLGALHARYWALVWGLGEPPPTGVRFSSGTLRFAREAWSTAVGVGPAWAAVAEGAYREATVDPDGSAPTWLALAQSR